MALEITRTHMDRVVIVYRKFRHGRREGNARRPRRMRDPTVPTPLFRK